jgi:hypothetical protein
VQSDFYERAVQDPDFVVVEERQAQKLIGQRILSIRLGTQSIEWPRHCLIPYPSEFDTQIDILASAVECASTRPAVARELVHSIDAESMKRWYIDVALQSGYWRARHGWADGAPSTQGKRRRRPMGQERLERLFARDAWRCRYCGIRIGGNRSNFKSLADAIGMPELIAGRTDEARHGLYLMLMGSYDHVDPHSRGGSDEECNLVTACWSCQFGKYRYELNELNVNHPECLPAQSDDSWRGVAVRS